MKVNSQMRLAWRAGQCRREWWDLEWIWLQIRGDFSFWITTIKSAQISSRCSMLRRSRRARPLRSSWMWLLKITHPLNHCGHHSTSISYQLWPLTRQESTCPFFSLGAFIWQRGKGRLFFENEGLGVHFCQCPHPNPPGRHHHHDPHLFLDDDHHPPGQASSEESVQAMMPASSKELNTSFASIQQWSSASRRKLVRAVTIVIRMMMIVVIMTITVVTMKCRWGSCSNKCWKTDLGDNRARNWWWKWRW